MVYKIKFVPTAKDSYSLNLLYLEENWSKKVITNYLKKVFKSINLIKTNPRIFPKWKNNSEIRRVVIVKQITMFYEVKKETINIYLFWNNYQNPENLNELLK
ncbi:MAG: type II toxin-antitoxin system RelE/ParE family toxin [Flavobacteriaceae bacterium]